MRKALSLGILGAVLAVSAPAAQQGGGRSFTGTIYDVGGGAIPGASVSLVAADGTRASTSSIADGRFELAGVAPGSYTLEAKLAGFHPLSQKLELRAAQDWNRVVTLQVGELTESISIRASRLQAPQTSPAPGAPQAPIRVGGMVNPPRKVADVHPVYPTSMRQAGLSGLVTLEAVVGKDGSVTGVRVMSAQVHPELASAAATAVRQWRYTPTLLNGAPVEVLMTVSVRFDLD